MRDLQEPFHKPCLSTDNNIIIHQTDHDAESVNVVHGGRESCGWANIFTVLPLPCMAKANVSQLAIKHLVFRAAVVNVAKEWRKH